MSELEEKLGSILQNPQMMQQIMGMAKALGAAAPEEPPKQQPGTSEPSGLPQIDPALLRQLGELTRQGGIDQHQQGLLTALQPYLSRERILKLERAMGAARMARAASAFLNSGGLGLLAGR